MEQQSYTKESWQHEETIHSIDYAKDGTLVVSGGDDSIIRTWPITSGQGEVKKGIDINAVKPVSRVQLSPDSLTIASSSLDCSFFGGWNAKTGHLIFKIQGSEEFKPQGSFDFEFTSQHILSGSHDGTIQVWERHDVWGALPNPPLSSVLHGHKVSNLVFEACNLAA